MHGWIMCAHTLLLVFLRKKLQKPLWNSLPPGFPCIRTPKPLPKHRHIPIISVMFPICFWLFCAIPWAIFFLLFRKKISRNVCRLHPFPFAGRTLKDCLPCLRSESVYGWSPSQVQLSCIKKISWLPVFWPIISWIPLWWWWSRCLCLICSDFL